MGKAALIVLAILALLAFSGRLRFPSGRSRRLTAARCPACGRPRIGNDPCPCGRRT